MAISQKLEKHWKKGKFICVGLDSDYSKIPPFLKLGKTIEQSILDFNKKIIDSTSDIVCSYKLNSAFYEAYGEQGILALKKTIQYVREEHPEIVIILDAKRADIGSTNLGYVKFAFDELGVDAITIHPYLGQEAVEPFLARKDKLIIVLVKTSNPGANEFQDLIIGKKHLYEIVAGNVAKKWNKNKNCGVVVGATYPAELKIVRKIVGNIPILIPGIGAQGGEIKSTIHAGKDDRSFGMIVNSSRGIIFASKEKDFAKVARQKTIELSNEIKKYL
jgi:orotidine-5'-phosphate decarboxylase